MRIDPLLGYLGADINDAKETAAFLRNGLNPLLEKYNCGAIINHHTPKVINRDTRGWRASDWMYAGAGSADLTNWARAILVIDPTHAQHVYKFIAAKRGGRIGWRYEDGDVKYMRYFCHDTAGGLAWRDATADDELQVEIKKPKKSGSNKTKEDLLALVPTETAIPKQALISLAQSMGIGFNRARGFISELVDAGELYVSRAKRAKRVRVSVSGLKRLADAPWGSRLVRCHKAGHGHAIESCAPTVSWGAGGCEAFFGLALLARCPESRATRGGKILIACSDCAQHLLAKSWMITPPLFVDFETSQTEVSDVDYNVLFRSPASA